MEKRAIAKNVCVMCEQKIKISKLEDLLDTLYKRGKNKKLVTSLDFEGLELTYSFECKILDFEIDYKSLTAISQRGELEFHPDLKVSSDTIKFIKCEFPKDFILHLKRSDLTINIEFIECTFKYLDLSNTSIKSKLRFRKCTFNKLNFSNTKFKDLADFWRCTFKERTIFYKTDFLATTVFSGSIFEENVLFTYTLIKELIIFRGTTFENGLDLSLAIIPGEISCFDIQITNFKNAPKLSRTNREKYEEKYEEYVSHEGEIPIHNKRETFRILKQTFVKQDNINNSIDFKVFEKKALFIEILHKFRLRNFKDSLRNIKYSLEILNLGFNGLSNWFGSSYGVALLFIAVTTGLWFNLSITSTDQYYFTLNPDNWDWSSLKYYAQFLLPTHRFDYLDFAKTLPLRFYLYDFFGRIFVSYGFYQFVQAFRKYR